MNREDIIAMARESGAIPIHESPKDLALVHIEKIERFADLVAAAEREACAKVCESMESDGHPSIEQQQCAAAIRARGKI